MSWCYTSLKYAKEPVAQLVEQKTFNLWVLGSSPSGLTILNIRSMKKSLIKHFCTLRNLIQITSVFIVNRDSGLSKKDGLFRKRYR